LVQVGQLGFLLRLVVTAFSALLHQLAAVVAQVTEAQQAGRVGLVLVVVA
jgi:hypothetical protein